MMCLPLMQSLSGSFLLPFSTVMRVPRWVAQGGKRWRRNNSNEYRKKKNEFADFEKLSRYISNICGKHCCFLIVLGIWFAHVLEKPLPLMLSLSLYSLLSICTITIQNSETSEEGWEEEEEEEEGEAKRFFPFCLMQPFFLP